MSSEKIETSTASNVHESNGKSAEKSLPNGNSLMCKIFELCCCALFKNPRNSKLRNFDKKSYQYIVLKG